MAKTTHLIHHPYLPPLGFVAPQFPTYKASTVIFPSVSAMRSRDWKQKNGYTYGLHGTPSSFTLEERVASIEGASYCQLVPSGLAAIALVNLSLLKSGDEVLIPTNAYAPNLALVEGELFRYGITHQTYDALSVDDLAQKLSSRSRLVWIEAPGSVTMEFPDLESIVSLCKQRGVLTALDNTWGAGLAFNAFELNSKKTHHTQNPQNTLSNEALAVDISIQALTKFASGGGDVLMGSICTTNEALSSQIKLTHMRLGLGVGSNDVETVLRSLPSMKLRYTAQDLTARALATYLTLRPEIEQVLHPALEKSPGHANWLKTCAQSDLAASIFSVIFKSEYSQNQVDLFCDSLKYFKIGYSWGGHMSLVVPYDLSVIRPLQAVEPKLKAGRLVRLCIGLEDFEDLKLDIDKSLQIAFRAS